MKAKIILAVALLLGVAVSSADAQITVKSRTERTRVGAGVRSGQITRPEAYRLHREHRHIRKDVHRARSNDGHIGPRERKHIRHEKRKHSRHIYRAKHNGHKRAY